MACLTKEQLTAWRQQGKTNVQIAEMTGRSVDTVNGLFSRYKIPSRNRGIPDETKAAILRMKESGSSIREIMEKTGLSESTVYNHAKAAGLIPDRDKGMDMGLPEVFIMAQTRTPRISRMVCGGKRYLDVTEIYIPL